MPLPPLSMVDENAANQASISNAHFFHYCFLSAEIHGLLFPFIVLNLKEDFVRSTFSLNDEIKFQYMDSVQLAAQISLSFFVSF